MSDIIYRNRTYQKIPIPPAAKDEGFTEYELADGAKLAGELKRYMNRRVILTGGRSWQYWPCILRGVTIRRRYRCLRDERGYVIRDPKRRATNGHGEAADWIPRKDVPKVASVEVTLNGNKALPTRSPYIGSWYLLVPAEHEVAHDSVDPPLRPGARVGDRRGACGDWVRHGEDLADQDWTRMT